MYRESLLGPSGAPCNAPPWGALSAVDVATGALRWEVPFGMIPQLGMFPKASEWGSINLGGAAVTAGGFGFFSAAMGKYLRGLFVGKRKEVWCGGAPGGGPAPPEDFRGDRE